MVIVMLIRGINMKIGDLAKKCPKCGGVDKTVKRDIETEHHAHATTGAVVCTKCGYVFKSKRDTEEE